MADEKLDPYAELGLDRGATPAQIKAAGKERAKKTHPDAGGSDAAFQRTQRAVDVLSDPEKRAKYDRTGDVEDTSPDNDRAGALQVIERHLCDLINAHIQSEFKPETDPRLLDVIHAVKVRVEKEIADARKMIATGETAEAYYVDLSRRFTCTADDDPIARSMEERVRFARKQTAGFHDGVRVRQLALDILATYSFRKDSFGYQPVGGLYIPRRSS